MKLNRRTFSALAALLLGAGATIAHAANALDTIKERKKILIAVDIGAPPYGMVDDQARQAGSDIDAAKLLAQDMGVALQIVPVTGPNRVPFLLTRKADIVVSSFSITEDRKKVVDYSEPYGVVPIVIAGPAAAKVASFADLPGKTIAVTRGTTMDQELTRASKEVSGITTVRYEDDATTNTAVVTGQQDYIATPPSVVMALKKVNPSRDLAIKFTMKTNPYGVGLRKNEPELKAWLDNWVKTNLKNGKLNAIYLRHHGMPLPAEMLP